MNEKNLNNFHAGGNSDQPFDPGTFGREEKIRNLGKIFKDEVGEDIDAAVKNKKSVEAKQDEENNYDKPVPEEEVAGFREEIEKRVEEKAKELKISKEKLIELAELDLESLSGERLESLNLNRGGLEFIRDSINRSINEFSKSGKPDVLLKESPSQFIEFVRKHKGKIGLAQLGFYLSAFGSPALKELAGDHAAVDIYGEKISLEDLAKNPELIKETGLFHKYSTPIKVPFEHFNVEFLFKIDTKIGADNNSEKHIYFDKLINNHIFDESNENIDFSKMEKELGEIGISLNGEEGGCSFDSFYENREAIINIISENLDIPKGEVENYVKNIIEMETSQMSLVKWEDWKVGENSGTAENNLKLQKEKERISCKVSSSFEGTLEEKTQKTEEEWLKWGKENGYNDVNKALEKEIRAYENSPIGKFKKFEEIGFKQVAESKKETGNPEKDAEFGNRFLEKLNESGYSMDELKKIAEKDPKKVIEITTKVIGKNVEYDLMQYLGFSKFIKTSDHSEDTPEDTLKKRLGVCDNYAKTLAASIYFLKENNVPNFDKIAILTTVVNTDYGKHALNTLIAADGEKLSPTSIDLTWADDENISKIPEKLNAVDDKHYYTKIKEKVGEAHQKALDKIKDWNDFVFQEKLKEILTQYNPKLHEREQRIEGNEKLKEKEANIEPLREERKKSIRERLNLVRNKLKKIYTKNF